MVAVALAPLLTSVDAARSTTSTCSGSGGDTSGACSGNSGTNGNTNKCTTTVERTGQGGGQGTIKDTTTTC